MSACTAEAIPKTAPPTASARASRVPRLRPRSRCIATPFHLPLTSLLQMSLPIDTAIVKRRTNAGLFSARAFRPSSDPLNTVFEALRLRQGLELLQRVVLDLADALARDAERTADLLERARLHPVEPEAELDHAPLALRERG